MCFFCILAESQERRGLKLMETDEMRNNEAEDKKGQNSRGNWGKELCQDSSSSTDREWQRLVQKGASKTDIPVSLKTQRARTTSPRETSPSYTNNLEFLGTNLGDVVDYPTELGWGHRWFSFICFCFSFSNMPSRLATWMWEVGKGKLVTGLLFLLLPLFPFNFCPTSRAECPSIFENKGYLTSKISRKLQYQLFPLIKKWILLKILLIQ